ncbi:hypothetical protein BG011_001962 [Mortierella polycephala]|uniref:GATA-type domain-containing protein n=1 Tax=Mortierella polycephala TaxID=41804 RepID=A0A9P6PKV9_9FUNG|nr:hypothetical protein BG011_001962 [Mortierella polycephala]
MFASHPATSVSPSEPSAAARGSDAPWMMSSQEVLDYTSFSDDSHSPVLSLESFSSQHSPDMGAFMFHDFESLSSNTLGQDHGLAEQTFQSVISNSDATTTTAASTAPNKSSASETARQAALLHAYLTAQNLAYNEQLQQQRWGFSAMDQLDGEKDQQEPKNRDGARSAQPHQTLDKIQQADADNLARYIAQTLVKQESSRKADVESDNGSIPSSPGSVMAERSSSPEAAHETLGAKAANKNRPSRQLVCFNCQVTQTPLWRRTTDRKHPLCNACGLYYKQYGAHRPLTVRHKLPRILSDVRASPYARPSNQGTRGSSPSAPESSSSSDSDSDSDRATHGLHSLPDLTRMYSEALIHPPRQKTNPPLMTARQGIKCTNCSQTQTPLWRKNDAGEPICNACGLYAKLHNRARPVTMRKAKITRRRRDWGGNLALQAQAQAQALALAHSQAQAQAKLQNQTMDQVMDTSAESTEEVSLVKDTNNKTQELSGRPTIPLSPAQSSDTEDERRQQQSQPQQGASVTAGKLSGNPILDENKFSDIVDQMNAHQMNRFLSILESRCGVLRNRLLARTETSSQQSSLDHLF